MESYLIMLRLTQSIDIFQFIWDKIGGTIASKIDVTLKGVYLPILKLHSILAV